jgi:hypothetical protein
MKLITLIVVWFTLFSCTTPSPNKQNDSLEAWIKENSNKIENDIEHFIKEYNREHEPDSNWVSTSYSFTLYSPNMLGQLAKVAGDSNQCIVVELTFSKFLFEKRKVMVVAEDSTCLNKIKAINLKTDSTDYFVYGVEEKLLF